MGSGEGDKWGQLGRERRTDPAYALEFVEGPEWAVGLAVGDDPGGQGWPDSGQAVQFLGAGLVEVYGFDGRCGRRG